MTDGEPGRGARRAITLRAAENHDMAHLEKKVRLFGPCLLYPFFVASDTRLREGTGLPGQAGPGRSGRVLVELPKEVGRRGWQKKGCFLVSCATGYATTAY